MYPALFKGIVEKFKHLEMHWEELFVRAKGFYSRANKMDEIFTKELKLFLIRTIDEEVEFIDEMKGNISSVEAEIKSAKDEKERQMLLSQKASLVSMKKQVEDLSPVIQKFSVENIEKLPIVNRTAYEKGYELIAKIRQLRDLLSETENGDVIQKIVQSLTSNLSKVIMASEFQLAVDFLNAAKDDIGNLILMTSKYEKTHLGVMNYNHDIRKRWNQLVEALRSKFALVYTDLAPLGAKKVNVDAIRGLSLS